jgi:hypothetical protein
MRRITGSAFAAASALVLLGACDGAGGGRTDGDGRVEIAGDGDGCVPDPGCTLTQGYWKTHSKHGPAPYDDAWQIFEEGELNDPQDPIYARNVPCYDVLGLTWFEQLWEPPRGNPWLQLSHQYAAAWLNYYNGADIDLVEEELDGEARHLLYEHCPGDPGFDEVRDDFVRLASRLEAFNSGRVGPPHCEE